MKQDLKGKLAVDASALIELVHSDKLGQKLKQALEDDLVEAWVTELALTELRYILCRKIGWLKSSERVNKLIESGYFKIEETQKIMNEAAKLKCCRAISLPDCFTIALAKRISGKALFARKEQELITELQKKPFDVNIHFLDTQI
jgi:predicted nucleic acid-binding protein